MATRNRGDKDGPRLRSRKDFYSTLLLALGLAAVVAAGCGEEDLSRPSSQTSHPNGTEEWVITVFAAASLTGAFGAIAREYQHQNPGSEVVLNFSGSQRLRTQLEHGARADVFASADWNQVNAVAAQGLAAGPPVNFTSNHLVILAYGSPGGTPEMEPLDPGTLPPDFRRELETLAKPGTKIVVGQPEVPIGRYTEQLLEKMAAEPSLGEELVAGLRTNVVSREASVRGIVQKVNLGEADAGVVYSSDAQLVNGEARVLDLPNSINVTANYPITALNRTPGAASFIDFVLSYQGQRILHRYGFGQPPVRQDGNP